MEDWVLKLLEKSEVCDGNASHALHDM